MSMTTFGRRGLATIVLMTAACGGAPTGGAGQGGQFDADLAGIVTTHLSGFATSSGQTGVTWTLQLITPGGDNTITMMWEGDGRPDPGAYPLVDFTTSLTGAPPGHFVGAVVLDDGLLPGDGFDNLNGTFTVSRSTPGSVSGSFSLTAFHSSSPASRLAVTGTFSSTNKDY